MNENQWYHYVSFTDPLELSNPSEISSHRESVVNGNRSKTPEFLKKSNSEIVKADGISVMNRQNSFRATRNFFAKQGGGLIISPKEYKKNEEKENTDEYDENTNHSRPLSNK